MKKRFRLFALGSNGSGQLGIGHGEDVAAPVECIFDEQDLNILDVDDTVVKIVAGGNHTLVLLASGAVFAAGSNKNWQCFGPADIKETAFFKRVIIPIGVAEETIPGVSIFKDVSATWEASFLLDTAGIVHVFGMGSKGELGLGAELSTLPQSGFLEFKESKVIKLRSSMQHTVAISEDGMVYGWGSCRKGELGTEISKQKMQSTPARLSISFKCHGAVLGRNFTILLGENVCKILGHGEDLEGVCDIQNINLDNFKAGWSTVYTLINGRLRAFGRDNRGQRPSEDLPGLKKLGAGSEHCLGLTINGQVVAWGWGEHGNCGSPTDLRGNVANGWNVLSVPLEEDDEVINVAAGCATSFLIVNTSS